MYLEPHGDFALMLANAAHVKECARLQNRRNVGILFIGFIQCRKFRKQL